MNRDLELRRIPMDSVFNFRSLGGYAAGEKVTRHGVFYRCGWLDRVNKSDAQRIRSLGIKTVIDLRDESEILYKPDVFDNPDEKEIKTFHINLMADFSPENFTYELQEQQGLTPFYRAIILDGGEKIRQVIDCIAENIDRGAVLFHCAMGKDRTGITAMALLSIAGVDRLDILADYQVSETYIFSSWENMGSDVENLLASFDIIDGKYGGAIEYLKSCGVSGEVMDKIRAVFLK
ncbi:MAG: tyrosine-protein phosphatase [Oscillospiraceae bacterium]|nr:tyrosine-protein phosphatase [Oscillospiraceae bacterium]